MKVHELCFLFCWLDNKPKVEIVGSGKCVEVFFLLKTITSIKNLFLTTKIGQEIKSKEKIEHKYFNNKDKIILTVASLTKQKNLQLLIKAFNLVQKKTP